MNALAEIPLPHDMEAERMVLSCLLQSPDLIDDAEERALMDDIYVPAHREVYSVMVELREGGHPVEPVSVTSVLQSRGKLDEVGGNATAADLYAAAPAPSQFGYYADCVADLAVRRSIIAAADATANAARDLTEGSEAALGIASEMVTELEGGAADSRSIGGMDLLKLGVKRLEERASGNAVLGPKCPWDGLAMNFAPGSMTVVAARPGVGKSMLAWDWAMHLAKGGARALIFSAEMSKEQIADRCIAWHGNLDGEALRTGALTPKQWEDVGRGAESYKDLAADGKAPKVYDMSAPDIRSIGAICRREHRRNPVGVVFIDYLQLLTMKSRRAGGSREVEVGDISRAIKALSLDLGIPIVPLAQINRQGADRPRVSHLRESGAIEADADHIVLLWADDSGQLWAEKAKDRNGGANEGIPFRWRMRDGGRCELGEPEDRGDAAVEETIKRL